MKPSVADESRPRRKLPALPDLPDLPAWAWPLAALVLLGAAVVAVEHLKFGRVIFLKPENLRNIVNQQSFVGVVAVGMTFVIIAGGIDLSVGSLVAALGVLCVLTANATGGGEALPLLAGLAAAVAAGVAAGALHGLLVVKGRVAAFVVTLGGLAAYRSVALWLAGSGEARYDGGGPFGSLANGGIPVPGTDLAAGRADEPLPLTIPWPIVIFLVTAAVAAFVLNRTRFGRHVVAVGGNERAAVYSGIGVDRVKIAVFALLGGLTGLAATLLASRSSSVSSGGTGVLLELDAIAAVVVGGTRLSGGRGTVVGTVLGVLILGLISNMLLILEVESSLQGLVKGLVIVAAVLVQRPPAGR